MFGWRRRAWWLIGSSIIYVIVGVAVMIHVGSGVFLDWLGLIQLVWIVLMSTPLWIKPLGRWVFNK